MTKEQAAIKDESGAEQPEQSDDAQDDDLDSLLAEHDDESQTHARPAAAGGGDDGGSDDRIDRIYQFIQQQEQRTQTEETNKAVSQAVKSIKEFAGTDGLDDDFVETFLQGRATKDARITKAFHNRYNNPAAWNAALKMVAKEVKKYAQQEDDDDDRESVAAAVRSGSTAKAESERDFPSEKEWKGMSDAEYQKTLNDIVKD